MQSFRFKPLVLTLAVAGALAAGAVQADTTLWGSARAAIQYVDIGDNPQGVNTDVPNYWDMVNPGTRIGFRGREELGGDLSAIWEYEFGVDNIEGGNFYSRTTWVGLLGGFGQLTAGRQYAPYYWMIGLPQEIWQVDETAPGYFYLGLPKYQNNSIVYYSPVFFGPARVGAELGAGDLASRIGPLGPIGMPIRNPGLQFGAAMVLQPMDQPDSSLPGDSVNDSGFDMWEIGAMYYTKPFGLNVAYRKFESNMTGVSANGSPVNFQGLIATAGSDVWGVSATYASGPFYVALTYQGANVEVGSSTPGGSPYEIEFTSQYAIAPHTFRLGYSYVNTDGLIDAITAPRAVDDINTWMLGYQYNFSKRTWVFAEYRTSQFYSGFGQVSNQYFGYEYRVFSSGIRHDF